jgi:hypothetical protein
MRIQNVTFAQRITLQVGASHCIDTKPLSDFLNLAEISHEDTICSPQYTLGQFDKGSTDCATETICATG